MDLPTPQDLRTRRKNLELTQSELAEMAGVSQPLIARIEGGDVDPRLSTLRRIVNALDESAGGIVRASDLMHDEVVSVAPDDSVREARDIMFREGYSQLPVIRDGRPEGIISNSDIRHAGEEHEENVGDLPVAEVMSENIPTVGPDAVIEEIDSYLDHHRAVIVVSRGEAIGIITEADVAAHLS